ncbi:MAG: type II secretion system GspH family protein [Endomicrobium sp.]|jgi:type II secretory pathway pseudopilin PulG|nr:type II secretion system GspH family protein [Endomicrobium sp.]
MNMRNSIIITLEILVAILVIAVTLFVSVPKFSNILRKSEDIATKKGLTYLRSAIALYYSENSGKYPDANIAKELVQKGYIQEIPYAYIPGHKKSNTIHVDNLENNVDTGGWAYKASDIKDSTGKYKGQIWVNCSCGDYWSNL